MLLFSDGLKFLKNSFVLGLCVVFVGGGTSDASDELLNTILKEGHGIRAMTMGNAFTGLGEGESAVFYNPAGLAVPGALYTYQNLDTKQRRYDHYQLHSFYNGPVGIGWVSAKNLENQSATVWNFGYGRHTGDWLDWGVTVKSFVYDNGTKRFNGTSSDLGVKLRLLSCMSLGFVAKDLYKDSDLLRTTYTGGVALYTPGKRFILTSDVAQTYEEGIEKLTYHYGTEVEIVSGLRLRGGVSDGAYTAGVGLRFGGLSVDYGFRDVPHHPEDRQHMIAFRLGRGLETYKPQVRYALFKPKAFAEFALGGNLTSGKSEVSLLGGAKIGTNDLLYLMHQAVNDDTCEGFIVKVEPSDSSIGTVGVIQELRSELLKAKLKGKKVYVYLDGWATLPEYYLASMADKIYMSELGSISHLGLELQVVKTRQLFKNFGFETEIVASGRFKDSLNGQSATLNVVDRDYLDTLVGQMYATVLSDIKTSRKMDWTKATPYFDGRIFMAREAQQAGLIDKLMSYEDMLDDLKDPLFDRPVEKASLVEFAPLQEGPPLLAFNQIAVVEIDGEIVGGGNSSDVLFGGKSTGSAAIQSVLGALEKDYKVKGVILRVNSPGGSVLASDDIYRAVKKLQSAKKVVYASFGNMAASGGYYVSMGAQKIFVNPGTLTGSVGVISSRLVYAGAEEKLGVSVDTVKTGPYMDLMSPHQRSTEDQKRMLYLHQDAFYQRFVDLVQENRRLTDAEVYSIAQGQVFTGEQAVKLQLADDVAGLYDVVDRMAKDLDIDSPDVVFVRPEEKFSVPLSQLSVMAKSFLGYFGQFGKVQSKLDFIQ